MCSNNKQTKWSKIKWKTIKKNENLLFNQFETNWHKRLDVKDKENDDDDIIFKKLMNRIILLFEIFDHHHMKIIQMMILQKK